MSDYDSSLPIRTENAGDAIVKVADATVPSQQLAIDSSGRVTTKLNDGAGNSISSTSNALHVNVQNTSIVVTATDLDIRDLTSVSDSVTVLQNTHDNLNANANIQVGNTDVSNSNPVPVSDAGGSLTVDASDLDIRDLTHVSDSVKVGDGTDFLAVNADGSINVKIADSSPGTAINNYNTVASVASGGTSTHIYTSTGNFYLTQIEASASGKMKIEVTVNGITRFVQFNSTSNPNMTIHLSQPILATSGQTVTVIRTNRDNQPQSVYSTILGYNE